MKVSKEIGLSEPKAAGDIIRNLHYKGVKIYEIIGDGSYDDKELFEICRELNIKPTIRIRKNSCKKARGSIFRKKHVIEFKELGYKEWSKKHKYGRRWIAESEFSRVKRKTGEFVIAKDKQNMFKEAIMKFYFYDLLIKYGENAEIFHQI
jgi:transposase